MKNKILIAIVAAAVLVLLGGPLLSSIFVERQIMALQDSVFLPKKNNIVTISRYDRGWFSSTAVIEYKIPFEFANLLVKEEYRTENEDHTWSIPIEIKHGPIIFGDGGISMGMAAFLYEFDFPPYPDDKRAEEFPDQVAITTDVLITLGGVFLSHATIPAGTWHQKTDTASFNIEFGGYDGTGIFDPSTGHVQVAGPWPDILVTVNTKDGATLEFRMEGMALDFDVTMLNEYLWAGSTDFEMGQFSMDITVNGNNTVFEWSGLELHDILSEETEGLLHDDNTLSLKQLTFQNSENNIDFTLSDFSSDAELKNLHIEAYSTLMEQMQMVGDTPELANTPEFELSLLGPLEQLINAGPEWNIKSLDFETNYGGGLYAHKFSVAPLDGAVTDMAVLLQGFLSHMVWDANLELDPDLATKLAESILKGQVDEATWAGLDDAAKAEAVTGMIQQFVDQGLIVAGERFAVSAKIENGILLIGDTPVYNIMDAIPQQ